MVHLCFEHVNTNYTLIDLGAQDFWLGAMECVSYDMLLLNLKMTDLDILRVNAQLTAELEELNRSLAEQVAARKLELEQENVIRREADQHA